MTLKEQRQVALSAARGELTHKGIQATKVDDFHEALDDLYRKDPTLVATQWYDKASDNQWKLFRREARAMIEQVVNNGRV